MLLCSRVEVWMNLMIVVSWWCFGLVWLIVWLVSMISIGCRCLLSVEMMWLVIWLIRMIFEDSWW